MDEGARPVTGRRGKNAEKAVEENEERPQETEVSRSDDVPNDLETDLGRAIDQSQTMFVGGVQETQQVASGANLELTRAEHHPVRASGGKSVAELMRFRRMKKRAW